MKHTPSPIDFQALAAHVLRHLIDAQTQGRLVRLDEMACSVGVRRADVRRVVTSLHREGHVDAQRMRLTMTGLVLATAMRDAELRKPRRATPRQVRAA